jgi:hypothetical protein
MDDDEDNYWELNQLRKEISDDLDQWFDLEETIKNKTRRIKELELKERMKGF